MPSVLITGAARGYVKQLSSRQSLTQATCRIGYSLTETYLKQANTTVVAAVRDPASVSALKAIQPATSSKLVIVKIRSGSNDDAKNAAQELQKSYNITSVDVVIANAGARSGPEAKVGDVDFDLLREHFEIKWVSFLSRIARSPKLNLRGSTFGPIALFKAFLPLLKASNDPKFVVIGTLASSSIFPTMGYGISHAPYALSKVCTCSFSDVLLTVLCTGCYQFCHCASTLRVSGNHRSHLASRSRYLVSSFESVSADCSHSFVRHG